MGCSTTLTLAEAVVGGDDMFHDAFYVASVDKIFATSGPYLAKCNATTGAKESSVRIISPVYGEMRLTFSPADGNIYVTCWNEPNHLYFSLPHPGRDIYPVDPASMVVGTALGVNSWIFDDFNNDPSWGPRWITASGNYLYFIWQQSGGAALTCRVNVTNLADHSFTGDSTLRFSKEHGGNDGTHLFIPDAGQRSIDRVWLDFSNDDTFAIIPYNPVACEFCPSNGHVYVVCGDTNLLNVDFGVSFSTINLGVLQFNADPVRVRYNSVDGQLYIPCPTAEVVIVFDPLASTGVVKAGFSNPIDCVFTPTKAFAVQESAVGLKEIV